MRCIGHFIVLLCTIVLLRTVRRREDVGSGKYGLPAQRSNAGRVEHGARALGSLAFRGFHHSSASQFIGIVELGYSPVQALPVLGRKLVENGPVGSEPFEQFSRGTEAF